MTVVHVDRFYQAHERAQMAPLARSIAMAARTIFCVPEVGSLAVNALGVTVWIAQADTQFIGDDFAIVVSAGGNVAVDGNIASARSFLDASAAERQPMLTAISG